MLDQKLESQLHERRLNHSLRQLTRPSGRIDFSSNDYLGLARSQELYKRIQQKSSQQPHRNGATGSRLLAGNSEYTEVVEKKLASIFQAPAALLFNSGYTANLAVLSAIPQRHDTILYDELAHACIKDGARLSLAARHPFRHNDTADLEAKLQKTSGTAFIAIESVYSMDGDVAPLPKIVELARTYQAVIILDEAHSTGLYGMHGSGYATALQLHPDISIRIHTFGKAMGVHGACVVGSSTLVTYLINYARPFIYTTALPPHDVCAIETAFEFLQEHPELAQQLKANIELYKIGMQTLPAEQQTASESAIQTVIIPGNEAVRTRAHQLQAQGFDIRPILSPTVKEGTERLRICLHAFNTPQEIESLVKSLEILTFE